MLDPEYLDRAGDLVGAAYGEIEADMLSYLCRALLDGGADGLTRRGRTALLLLSQTHATRLRGIISAHSGDVSRAVAATVEDALSRSDRADARRLGRGTAEAADATRPRQVELTVGGIARILERDNVDMVRGALDLWNRQVARAATEVNTGRSTAERAIRSAVRRMAAEGVATVQYRDAGTGRQTVRNAVDVAVRRHVRTQIAQDGMRRTLDVCEGAGVRLVEVSSHGGARPSHARWQGRVYSLDGDVTIGGVRYRDFYRETGYGSVDGLGGANCRHSFGPYVPGARRMYSPEPEHPSGLPGDEAYELTQGQRRRERAIRGTKRELAAARLVYEDSGEVSDLAEVMRLQDRLRAQQADMRSYVGAANRKGSAPVLQRSPQREWAGDAPRDAIAASAASKRRAREVAELKEKCARKARPVYTPPANADNGFGANMRRNYGRLSLPGEYIVAAHGSPKTVELLGKRSDHKVLADIIEARKDYDPAKTVRLYSCSTGKVDESGDCFAQRLADRLGTPVIAPTDTIWLYPDGTVEIGARMGDNDGSWVTFEPRGGRDGD